MRLGINYTWGFNKYGWYFGPHWRDGDPPKELEMDGWLIPFEHNLRHWRQNLGVCVVRIFLLCNLQNLGSAPQGQWRLPSRLDHRFLDHLTRMLQIARSTNVQLIPSLVDFGVGCPVSGARAEGRHSIISDPAVRASFFHRVFLPFLEVSKAHRDQVFAWEIINEPSWLLSPVWPFERRLRWPCVSPSALRTFLSEGVRIVRDAGFESTIGHRFLRDLSLLPTGSIEQFHFYGRAVIDPWKLPHHQTRRRQTIVGEFSVVDADQGSPWRWLRGRDTVDTQSRVCERLLELKRLGYPMALIWPDEPGFTWVPPCDPKISAAVAEGIVRFLAAGGG